MTPNWSIYRGEAERAEKDRISAWLSDQPPWRVLHAASESVSRTPAQDDAADKRGQTYVSSGDDEVMRVNMALLLRRPLLVTGPPGVGKSTLAYRIAWELGLGAPLRWEINSRTTLQDGLYVYDAVGHLQASQTPRAVEGQDGRSVGDFITLGPLGTALLPTERPRLLLIDELDKASFDLPNDLLHVFEEGCFTIPELVREKDEHEVYPQDRQNEEDRVPTTNGRIAAHHHPVVVVTSNDERPFPPAFLRRCVQLKMERPDTAHIERVIRSQFGADIDMGVARPVLERFANQTTDRVLQALYLHSRHGMDLDMLAPMVESTTSR